jgi:RNA polymerase sigma-70 factor (ECF subfamily)
MTNPARAGNQVNNMGSSRNPLAAAEHASPGLALDFDAVYEAHVDFAWRAARRMGLGAADAEDVVQEAFVVVHRRLAEFEGRADIKTWVFKILLHLVRHHFRTHLRRPGDRAADDPSSVQELVTDHDPAAALERSEAVDVLDRLLGQLDDDKREVLVLTEIEQMTLAQIAEVTGANPNTVASRLRAARQEFEKLLSRFQAREQRRQS